jgi:prepilin-type N-terminal cleavage/methylation domain-containing protein
MGAVHRDRGFTLVEILIAIVLVGILSAVVVVGVGSLTSKGSSAACSASLDAARVAATAHTVATGAAPASFTAMVSSGALSLPAGVSVDATGQRISGSGWTLVMRSATPLQLTCFAGASMFPADLTATGTVQAFSLRQLSSSYSGPAVRVRRSTDNTLQDIGFTASGELDTAALLAFVGSGNGYVAIWYDQSGNGRNATQAAAGSQPRIVTSGAFEGGVSFATGTILALTGTPASWSASVVGAPIAPGSWRTFFYTQPQQHALLLDTGLTALGAWDGGFRASGYTWAGGETAVVHVDATSANIAMSKNGGALVQTGSNTNRQSAWLGNCDCGNQPFGLVREVVVFATSLSTSDRQLVDRNLGAYYGVTVA